MDQIERREEIGDRSCGGLFFEKLLSM